MTKGGVGGDTYCAHGTRTNEICSLCPLDAEGARVRASIVAYVRRESKALIGAAKQVNAVAAHQGRILRMVADAIEAGADQKDHRHAAMDELHSALMNNGLNGPVQKE